VEPNQIATLQPVERVVERRELPESIGELRANPNPPDFFQLQRIANNP
jgi:hypothetical protein